MQILLTEKEHDDLKNAGKFDRVKFFNELLLFIDRNIEYTTEHNHFPGPGRVMVVGDVLRESLLKAREKFVDGDLPRNTSEEIEELFTMLRASQARHCGRPTESLRKVVLLLTYEEQERLSTILFPPGHVRFPKKTT
jgi:hypothetical protein